MKPQRFLLLKLKYKRLQTKINKAIECNTVNDRRIQNWFDNLVKQRNEIESEIRNCLYTFNEETDTQLKP